VRKFLLDANLSTETAEYLREVFSFDVESLIEKDLAGLSDSEVVKMAKKEKRIIITLDLDFGELYHQKESVSNFGVLILRLRDQRVESINSVLSKFFRDSLGSKVFIRNPNALVVINETTMRII
jgi:predicted nuclease of predicted toxin-antitoxin system